jgi:transcriptional regulator with XRE-family HTH domain
MSGQELRKLRQRIGWSQVKMGEYLGYTERYIRQLERDEVPIIPRLEFLLAILSAVYDLCTMLGMH